MWSSTELSIMRHAESLEDIDYSARSHTKDEDIPLSEHGRAQAIATGIALNRRLRFFNKVFKIFVSPSKRAIETAKLIVSQIKNTVCQIVIDQLLTKQNTGILNVNNRTQLDRERYKTGVLRYKYPEGESGWEALERFKEFAEKLQHEDSRRILVITHGFEMRLLLMALLGWNEEYFESIAHPNNCEEKKLKKKKDGNYKLKSKMRKHGRPITRLQQETDEK